MCAVFPEPASSTTGRPVPPQSSTSSRMPSFTVTNCTVCLDGSCQGTDSCADSVLVVMAEARRQTSSKRCIIPSFTILVSPERLSLPQNGMCRSRERHLQMARPRRWNEQHFQAFRRHYGSWMGRIGLGGQQDWGCYTGDARSFQYLHHVGVSYPGIGLDVEFLPTIELFRECGGSDGIDSEIDAAAFGHRHDRRVFVIRIGHWQGVAGDG